MLLGGRENGTVPLENSLVAPQKVKQIYFMK